MNAERLSQSTVPLLLIARWGTARLTLRPRMVPETKIVDISKSVMALRMVKSDEEIAVIKNGARIADIGGEACREAIAAGVPEYEVALASTGAMVREMAKE